MEDKGFGLYIHIPFCKKKCNYCDFISYINMEYFIPQYIETLKKEMDFYKDYCSKRKIRNYIYWWWNADHFATGTIGTYY